jgi:CDGSH-type Zn-finger protein/uncharacterized Fe-S cluster protein YjdI
MDPNTQGKPYTSEDVTVTFIARRCIHSAECLRRLPQVFDTRRHPWIEPTAAGGDPIVAAIEHCPSGALHFERKDGRPAEIPEAVNTVTVRPSGSYFLRGDLELVIAGREEPVRDTRMALCRCGASANKPFCDNTHRETGFSDPAARPANPDADAYPETGAKLRITARPNGSYLLEGPVEVRTWRGEVLFRGEKTYLCRCGGSADKPFCDGTHKTVGFEG